MGGMDDIGQVEIPGVKHKVIGLVSGGKDSTFNLLHCVANGHEVVALATLTPEAGIGVSLNLNCLRPVDLLWLATVDHDRDVIPRCKDGS